MTEKSSATPTDRGVDQEPYEFKYDHGRMPLFMKLIWVGFLIMATWYIVANLLEAVSDELA